MDLNEVLVFVRVVQEGSFSKAARALGIPKSTVSAKVASMERRLGVALLQRTTRQQRPTEAGAELFAICSKAVADIEAGQTAATMGQGSPQGLLRVTAPVDIVASALPEFLCGFTTRHPAVQLDLVLTGRMVDLVGEGVDIAIRAGRLKDSSLIARKLGITRFALFAAPSFLAGRKIDAPARLQDHPCIGFSRFARGTWDLRSGERELSVKVGGSVCVDDLLVVKELTIAGHGIALLPIYLARKDVRGGRLKQVLPAWHSVTEDVSLVYPQQRFVAPKVKAFLNEAHEHLKGVFTDKC